MLEKFFAPTIFTNRSPYLSLLSGDRLFKIILMNEAQFRTLSALSVEGTVFQRDLPIKGQN